MTKTVALAFKICGKETFLVLSTTRLRRKHGGKQRCSTLLVVKFTEVIVSFTFFPLYTWGEVIHGHRRPDVTTKRKFVYTRYRIPNSTPYSGILLSHAGRQEENQGQLLVQCQYAKWRLRHVTLTPATAFLVTVRTGQMTATNLSTHLRKRSLQTLNFGPLKPTNLVGTTNKIVSELRQKLLQ